MEHKKINKKREAQIHNNTMEIASNMFPLGKCNCEKGEMFMYLKSSEENMFNIYCSECEDIKDFRKVDTFQGLNLWYPPSQILQTLIETYGEQVGDYFKENKNEN